MFVQYVVLRSGCCNASFLDASFNFSIRFSIIRIKKLLPLPQSPKRPSDSGGSTSVAARTEQSASTSFVIPNRSVPSGSSGKKPGMTRREEVLARDGGAE